MYGTQSATRGGGTGSIGSFSAASLSGGNVVQPSGGSDAAISLTPWLLAVFVILYLVWAAVEQHERIKEAVSPSNIALNVRNIVVIAFTAILGIVWLKLLVGRLASWQVPGSGTLAQIIGAA